MTRTGTAAVVAAFLLLVAGVPAVQAASLGSDGTTATFVADPGTDDSVEVKSIDADTVQVTAQDDEIVEGANCSPVKADTTQCEATRLVAELGDGHDHAGSPEITTHALALRGGPGEDYLYGGSGDDELSGGPGNDTVVGIFEAYPAGNDRLDGGSDDDTLVIGAEGDEATGGTGSDRVTVVLLDTSTLTTPPADLSVSLDDVANDARPADGANVHTDVEHIGTVLTDQMENGLATLWGFDANDYDEGRLTARGSAGPNSVWGGTDDDDLDPLGGNDVVSAGHGNDSVTTVDGFADRVACGPGADTARADTLDDVSESCENVERTDAGNANDVPEDAPPAVTLATGPTLTAAATDDRGVGAVQFLDDDRLLCTDDAAPYTCDYTPRGEDVGRNTITAIAIDTAQQTASDRRAIAVPRFAVQGVTLRATRRRVSGRVVLPPQVAPALGCTGSVAITAGRVKRRAKVEPDCTYSARVKVRRRARVRAVFGGNAVLDPGRKSTRVR